MRAHSTAILFVAAIGGCYASTGVGYHAGYVGPAPVVYTAPSASVSVETYEPDLVDVGGGVQVIADYDEPVFYTDNFYWRFYGGSWYRSNVHTGGWTVYNDVPYSVRRIDRPQGYVRYRPQGYVPRDRRDHREGYRDNRQPYRDNRGPEVRDHRQPGYQPVRDQRQPYQPAQPDVRDHRQPVQQPYQPPQPDVRDHRQPTPQPYQPAPQPDVRDHRQPTPQPYQPAPQPDVRDHRAPAPAPAPRDTRPAPAPAPAPTTRDQRTNDRGDRGDRRRNDRDHR